MFIVIYAFTIKPNKNHVFEKAWRAFTQLIYEYEGSLGSRLHRNSTSGYIAYAQWPDRETWLHSGDHLPEESIAIRQSMRDACEHIQVVYELDVVADLLKSGPNIQE